jgi:NitT/TauT family transport system ATP-binding protein
MSPVTKHAVHLAVAPVGDDAMLGRQVADPLIRISALEKRYQTRSGETVNALTGVNLDIGHQEFVSIVGPSGCGKTTLLRILAGLEQRTSGSVAVGEKPVLGPRDDISVVFQQATLLPWYTVLENILMPARLKGDKSPEVLARTESLLNLVGLADFGKKYPFELSGGMQQRVSICRALIRNPKILLMDEPFGALDAMTRELLNIELLRIWSEERKTVLFITHSIPEAVFLADRVVVMSPRPGRISGVLNVDIPRPRTLKTLGTPDFGALCDQVRTLFGIQGGSSATL